MRKRVLSLLLAICLVMGMLPPTSVVAADSSSGGETPAAATESVTLTFLGTDHEIAATNTKYFSVTGGSASTNSTVADITAAVEAGTVTDWNIKLDNRYEVAELTIQNTNLYSKNGGVAMRVGGKGKLKITVTGTSESLIYGNANNALVLAMEGGTTITSVNNQKLTVYCNSSASYDALHSEYALRLENANIYVYKRMQNKNGHPHGAICVKADLYITNSTVDVDAVLKNASGIYVEGKLTITNKSVVTVDKASNNDTTDQVGHIFGVYAKDGIVFGGGKLEIKDASAYSRATTYTGQQRFDGYVKDNESYSIILMAMPDIDTLVDETEYEVVALCSDSYDYSTGTKELKADDPKIREYRYVSFELKCNNHVYDQNDPSDTTCNKCGFVREVAKNITVTIPSSSITWNATAGQTYYATTNENGVVTELTTAPTDDNWNIKLDNTGADGAVLTLKRATVKAAVAADGSYAFTASGEGKLKIVVAEASSIANSGFAMKLDMAGGTTITSLNKSLLTVTSSASNGYGIPITVTRGSICFENANIYTSNQNKNGSNRYGAINTSQGEVIIDNSTINHISNNCSSILIRSATTVTIRNFSKITTTSEIGDPAYQNSAAYYRFAAIEVGGDRPTSANTITIDTSTVEIINKAGCYRKMFNVMPTITGATAKYDAESYLGTTLQDLTETAVNTIDACKYVKIEAICNPHVYDSNNPYDYDCNNCGYIDNSKPRDITVQVVTDGGVKQTMPLTGDYNRTVTVPAGEIYYGIADANGLVTAFQKYDAEPEGWDFKVDNTRHEAQLIFNNAKLCKTNGDYKDGSAALNLMTVTGPSALQIILRGNSMLSSTYGHVIRTEMTGGTTYASEDAGTLLVEQNGTSGIYAISEGAGNLTFNHANINAFNQRYSTSATRRYAVVHAVNDMTVIGGKLNLTGRDAATKPACAVMGISAGGALTLSEFAIVTVQHISTKADEYGDDYTAGTTDEYKAANPRYGVTASSIVINDANLYIIDKANKFDQAINMMPTLIGTNMKAYYSENTDGSGRQTLTPADNSAPIEYAYVAFVYDCAGAHTYDPLETDPDCDKCGEIREVPRDITATFAYQTTSDGTLYDFTQTVPAGKVYYGKTDADGTFTTIGLQNAEDAAPAGWTIMLDNTQPTAVLTLHNAYLKKAGGSGRARDFDAINIVGEGALQIIVDGDSTIDTEYNVAIKTSMTGGTTYTSKDNSLLTVNQKGTSGITAINETVGTLTFKNANIYARNSRYNTNNNAGSTILAAGDMDVINSHLSVNVVTGSRIAAGSNGIKVGGVLTLSEYSQVTVKHTAQNTTFTGPRYGVNAASIVINKASLRVVDNANMFTYSINVMPNLTGVKAEYSENADGTGAVALPQDATFPVDHPYVGFVFDCIGVNQTHTYDLDNWDGDPDCNLCGTVRDVPRDVTIRLRTDGGTKDRPITEVLREAVVKANEVYYAVADDNGYVTEFSKTEPAEWDVMLDNRNPVAQLVFNSGAYLYKTQAHDGALLNISGEGALQIVNKGNATIKSGASSVIMTSMGKGTTYTSVGDSKLTINQVGTSLSYVIYESTGKLTFKDANLYVTHNNQNPTWPRAIIYAAQDLAIIGGQLDLIATNLSIRGIYVAGDLSLDEYAIVNIKQTSTSEEEFKGITGPGRENDPQYRYGVTVNGDFTINNASLYVIDNTKNMFEYAINKMPKVTGNTKAYSSTSIDGSNLQTLDPADKTAKVEYAYVAFAYDCNNQHDYTNGSDPVCNKCGAVRVVPYPITVTITNIVSKVLDDGKQIVWNAAIGQVYYATTDAQGVVTDLGALSTEPAEWNIKLDNTNDVAELTFKNATIKMQGSKGLAAANSAIKVAGEGTLKIIADGNNTVESGYNSTLDTAMKGGTTYTSVNGGKLTLNQNGTSGQCAIKEGAGVLNFENANIRVTNNRNHTKSASSTINAISDVNISGGSIEIEALNCSTRGLFVSGNLKLTNWAKVHVIAQTTNHNRYEVGTAAVRHAVRVDGEFVIDNASLRVIDAINSWDAAVNKSPKLIGATAKYSENAKGTDLQPLNPADTTKAVEYPYVEYVINCAEHIWDNDADPDCNRCGLIRAVPYDIKVAFLFGSTELTTVAWDVKVGEIYYATTTAAGQVVSLGAKDSEPAKWNIKLDNTGPESVLTFREATIIRKVRPGSDFKVLDIGSGSLGTVTVLGKGALRIVCEKASTITTDEAYESITTSMNGGTTYESKNNAKLTLTGKKTAVTGGIKETVSDLTFDHANVYVKTQKTSKKWPIVTVSTPKNLTVIGGKVEIVAAAYANSGLSVGGDLLVKENGILIVTTSSSPNGGGDCENRPYGVTVTGDITVDNATLMVKNYSKYWKHMINKMPILVNAAAYGSATSTKESKLEVFTAEAGSDLTTHEAVKFMYFSNAKPGTLVDEAEEEEEEEFDDSFIFDDSDNPFTGDTVNVTLLFALVMTSAAALVVLFSKKKSFRE